MKICYISNSASPSKNASSLQIAKLCENLSKIGNDVILILPNTGFKLNFYNFYNIKKKFKIIRLNFFKKFPTGLSYYFFGLISVFKGINFKPDIFITRNFFVCLLLIIFNRKIILEVHDTMNIEGRIIKKIQNKFNFLNSKKLVKIVATTKTLKKYYTRVLSVNSKKIQVLHNASSLKHYFKNGKIKKKYNIGYFGSIFSSRGLNTIINLSKLDSKNNYFIFGGDRKKVRLLKNQNLNNNLTINKYVPYKQIYQELKKIDICILPYTKKITVSGDVGNILNYTSPLKIFDYMSNGKLIISSNINVLKEVLSHKKNCIFVKKFTKISSWLKIIKTVTYNYPKYDNLRYKAYKFSLVRNGEWRAKELINLKNFS